MCERRLDFICIKKNRIVMHGVVDALVVIEFELAEIENEKRKINFSTFQELEPLLANFNFGYFFTF
jgi:hypothetical protein